MMIQTVMWTTQSTDRLVDNQADNDDIRYELIDGEIFEMSPPGLQHGSLASEISRHLGNYVVPAGLGIVSVETGYHPPNDRSILLSPDVAFTSVARLPTPLPKRFAPFMPDLAVEIVSPSNTVKQVRRKAAIYLRHGTQIVWIVWPDSRTVEVCRQNQDSDIECAMLAQGDSLTGELVLPGFALELRQLFTSL